ncbi:uncharacterized protein LOC119909675 isoform X2 [Micropterus salmoides]|uniref:uncharacterized protein LOC119909675 isoform X2 n=1 Tax=Micropterus salmoides TaxID=27706 RepID=UPI0018ED7A82|nr:uncharacterized protein LOC119909675 isoform X2 [Micropterus salmoides]
MGYLPASTRRVTQTGGWSVRRREHSQDTACLLPQRLGRQSATAGTEEEMQKTNGFLQLCSALNINCTVTDDDQTKYSISDVSWVSDAKAMKCEYSWTGTQVIANQNGEMPELVLTNNINTLVILKCLDNIVFTRSCVSEGTEYTANCTVNCTLKALRLSQKETRYWIPSIVVLIIFLLAVVVLMFLGFLYSKHKTCSQLGCIYTVVTKQSVDPDASDVEAGKE